MGLLKRKEWLAVLAVFLASCGGGSGGTSPASSSYTATSGVAQKGPLIQGSTVTAQELTAALAPNGKQYTYQITSNLGTFSPNSSFGTRYIGLVATGYYFDEVANVISSGTITLNGVSDLSAQSVLNVNLLTTLAYQRIENLVTKSNMTYAAASTEAENEVLAALNIANGSSYGSFGSLDLSQNTDGDHILAAVSSVFTYGNTSGNLSALIASFQSDLGANGVITNQTTAATLAAAAKALSPATIAANLTHEYASLGITYSATDISDWIDQDGDGLVGKFKFQVPDATPTSSFSFPSFVTDPYAGTEISVSAGTLSVNGTVVTAPVTTKAGDVVSVSPPTGAFPSGVLTIYLSSGTSKIGRVSFISGLSSIAVTPADPSLPVGLTQQFMATGTFTDGSTANLTASAAWTSSSTAIATVNATSGLVSAVAPGQATITATSGSVSGSTTVTVQAAVIESIAVTPNPFATGVGFARQLTATATFSDGSTGDVTSTATWMSSTPSAATVTGGLVTGVGAGSTTITATSAGVSGTTSLAVSIQAWSLTGSMSVGRFNPTANLLGSGKVLVVGGSSLGFQALGTAELYDPVSTTWSSAGTLPADGVYHTSTLLLDGTVLVAGGRSFADAALGDMASTAIYNPVANTWSAGASMANARDSHTATLLLNGKVLVAGGESGITPLASAEIYDPVAQTWSSAGSMTNARANHTATLLPNGQVLVAGGTGAAGTSAEIYDPTSNTWSVVGNLTTARSYFTATLLNNGTVLAAGGNGASSAEIYDPVATTWSPVASMSTVRAEQTATLLGNGTVLVAGGAATASAEIYDPVANTWTLTTSMAYARGGAAAVLLQNGIVLVAGSDNNGGATCELYW